jgi:hypothetical protein
VNYSCDRDVGLTYQKGEDGILRRVTECYAAKKYGDDWQRCHDYEDIAEEFEEWLEDAN